jgi:ABC-2 type transport system permease protein
VDPGELQGRVQALAMAQQAATRRAEVKKTQLQNKRNRDLQRIRRERDQQIQKVQNEYKLWATLLPPIPPLLLGLVIFAYRRMREREGISRTRTKY